MRNSLKTQIDSVYFHANVPRMAQKHQFDDAHYAAEKLVKAGMSREANMPEILEAMEIMNIAPWDGTSKEIFAARIKQILRGNVSRSDFSRGGMDGIRLKL